LCTHILLFSLPGSADQNLHADTPHLFEHLSTNLPAHYINVFAPCTDFHESVGGTALIHGSHQLAFTAKHYSTRSQDRTTTTGSSSSSSSSSSNTNPSSLYSYLVRPKLEVGDVLLFDCRILHFGLANTSKTIERCVCYINTWHDWFHDHKNWDNNRSIFPTTNDDNDDDNEIK